jgi:hypothetical protein
LFEEGFYNIRVKSKQENIPRLRSSQNNNNDNEFVPEAVPLIAYLCVFVYVYPPAFLVNIINNSIVVFSKKV